MDCLRNYFRPNTPYVVLVGDVGCGKSTIVEKLTGEKGRSSAENESVTKTSEPFWASDGSLVISDTPGSNAMRDKLEHNVWIAGALNFRPVSRIFIIAKAEIRIDQTVDNARKYAERFLDIDQRVIAVLVTHMDTVTWSHAECSQAMKDELGIEDVVYSGIKSPKEALLRDILRLCTTFHNIRVDEENFLKLFKINNSNCKILRTCAREIDNFKALFKEFNEASKRFSGSDEVDLMFEFQAWMTEEIIEAQKRLSEENNFTFLGDGAANEAGHVANMTNQLRNVLYDIRIATCGAQSDHGVNELRRCPHCGLIWAKIEGCDGATTCGNLMNKNDLRNSSNGIMATFSFFWKRGDQGKHKGLEIQKSGSKNVRVASSSSSSQKVGCGRQIEWNKMAMVPVPSDFQSDGKISTDDIKVLPKTASGFENKLKRKLGDAENSMLLGKKPAPSS